jgi:hypothetical protein
MIFFHKKYNIQKSSLSPIMDTGNALLLSNNKIPPSQLSRWDGDIFEYCLQVASKGDQKYFLFGNQQSLHNHYGAIYSQSSELLWLCALDSFNVRSEEDNGVSGRGVFLYAEMSKGIDDLNIVLFCDGESMFFDLTICRAIFNNLFRQSTGCEC